VEFTLSVPFERFTELKGIIEARQRWRRLSAELSFFETRWKPQSWTHPYRFILIRKRVRCQDKAPVQLDLFKPIEYGYEFKVIVPNKSIGPRKVVAFHEELIRSWVFSISAASSRLPADRPLFRGGNEPTRQRADVT